MSAVSGLLGMGGGANGTGFNVQSPISSVQVGQANQGVQQSLANQQGFLNAVQPGGTQALQSQQDLLTQLSQQAQGVGPNPALAQLNQTTGQNVAATNALMAGQRGASQNTGLIARQAAQQGATTQQNAVGQAATLNAQQQLAARQQLAAQQAQMVGQQQNAISQQMQGQLGNQGQVTGALNQQNATQGQLAGQQIGGQQNMIGNLLGAAGTAALLMMKDGGEVQPMADGGQTQINPMAALGNVPTVPAAPSGATPGPQSNVGKYMATDYAGGNKASGLSQGSTTAGNALGTAIGKGLNSLFGSSSAAANTPYVSSMPEESGFLSENVPSESGFTTSDSAAQDEFESFAHGGKVPALVSPGEIRIHAKDVKKVAKGKKSPMSGEKIPGKPKVGGAKNSYKNDTVHKTLNEGDIILPRSVTQAKHPHWEAHKFVSALMAKNKGKLK